MNQGTLLDQLTMNYRRGQYTTEGEVTEVTSGENPIMSLKGTVYQAQQTWCYPQENGENAAHPGSSPVGRDLIITQKL